MKVVIIEDEKHQQQLLSDMLNTHFPQVELVGIASNIDDGFRLITDSSPNLIFLDVELPPDSGFDLLNKFGEIRFDIIFTTSYEEYAIKAFKLSAIDYILKPVSLEELAQAIKKYEEKASAELEIDHVKVLLDNLKVLSHRKTKVALPTLTGFVLVAVEDIIRCESDNTYTTFYLIENKKILVSKTLKVCENLLQDFSFYRVHNSSLVNLEYIKEYTKVDGGVLKMEDGSEVSISRRRKDEFLKIFQSQKL